jgi:hypothetical protein
VEHLVAWRILSRCAGGSLRRPASKRSPFNVLVHWLSVPPVSFFWRSDRLWQTWYIGESDNTVLKVGMV